MTENEIGKIVDLQKKFFLTGFTLSVKNRICYLKKLRDTIRKYDKDINEALKLDLGKSAAETFMCETGLVLGEISHMISHIKNYSRDRVVSTPLAQFASKSFAKKTPFGTVLIMSPWNYPFLLTVTPLVDAIAAGNTAVIKPGAYSPASCNVISKIISEVFPPEYVSVITGSREENKGLLEQKFDMIFFTGGKNVGKLVMRNAAENLTPVVLELGGKSPCIIDSSAKIPLAAKRIVFGKFLNCGQTCVAPDYILCHTEIKNELIAALKKEITSQFGTEPLKNEAYGKIINYKHFERILKLIDAEKVVFGGKYDKSSLKIEPTLMEGVCEEDNVMKEEIFGPVLPILTYKKLSEAKEFIEKGEKPLALYIFSEHKESIRKITESCRFGGGCINDVIIHLATSSMGFGGVGESGMGSYHGKAGFDAFSHTKSIVDKKTFIDMPMRYQPYSKLNERLIRFFLK